jgi:hypothetical protein
MQTVKTSINAIIGEPAGRANLQVWESLKTSKLEALGWTAMRVWLGVMWIQAGSATIWGAETAGFLHNNGAGVGGFAAWTQFPTAAHLVSWAGLAAVARQSGPRTPKPKKWQGDAYLKGCCTQAANGAARTEPFLGERLRRLSRPLGGNRAKCAVARSILVIIWHLLSNPEARYTDLGPDWHTRKTDRNRATRNHVRHLEALGYRVTLDSAA